MKKLLSIQLFNHPNIYLNDTVIKLTGKNRLLLFYLLNDTASHSRNKLADLLWADVSPDKKKNSLRVALHHLNKYFPYEISSCHEWVQWRFDPSSKVSMDTTNFKKRLKKIRNIADVQKLQRLYGQGFLADISFSKGTEKYQAWVQQQQQMWQQTVVLGVFNRLQRLFEEKNFEVVVAGSDFIFTLDPAYEPCHVLLMQMYAEQGLSDSLNAQYQLCAEMLRRSGRSPQQQTINTYEQLTEDSQFSVRLPFTEQSQTWTYKHLSLLYCHWRVIEPSALDADEQILRDWAQQQLELYRLCIQLVRRFQGHVVEESSRGMLLAFGCTDNQGGQLQQAVNAGEFLLSQLRLQKRQEQLVLAAAEGNVLLTSKPEGKRQHFTLSGALPVWTMQIAQQASAGQLLVC